MSEYKLDIATSVSWLVVRNRPVKKTYRDFQANKPSLWPEILHCLARKSSENVGRLANSDMH